MARAPRRPGYRKYGNRQVEVNGLRFDSQGEADRYGHLAMLQKLGEITDLEVHPKYEFLVNGVRVGSFRPDFRYRLPDGATVVEDYKSGPTKTEAYGLRKRLLKALFGLDVVEVERRKR